MDYDGRAARRPLPRQMDVSDCNVDVDVRNGVSSSLGVYLRDRSAAANPASRRLSSGDELRNDVHNLLQPTNRYDSTGSTSARAREEFSMYSYGRRVGETAARAAAPAPRPMRQPNRVLELELGSQRPQPRAIPSARRTDEPLPTLHMNRDISDTELGARFSAFEREREPRPITNTTTTASIQEETTRQSNQRTHSPVDWSPPRDETRYASPASTVRSDASTVLTSPPFTPSVTDTPISIVRSTRTPPYTPTSSNDTSSRHPSPESTPSSTYLQSTLDSSPNTTTNSSAARGHEDESLSTSTSTPEIETATTVSSLMESTITISPRQQREQLYDFRRDMRQVFARVDEMVDLHRDLFKSDALSGMPAFNSAVAQDTARFANETFAQLTDLRQRFKAITAAWVDAASDPNRLALPRQMREETPTRRTSVSSADVSSISSRTTSSNDNDWSVEESTISTDSSLVSSRASSDTSHPMQTTPRWEPTLSALSNDDDDSSSASSSLPASVSDVCSSSLPSDLPTISRPSTASSSAPSSRANVFDDFDRRMEEIRASLNAIAREKPCSPRQRSARSSTSSNTYDTSRFPSEQNDEGVENNARVGNPTPWHPPPNNPPPATTRHDREARLRQLLRELQTTGEHLDHDAAT